MNEIPEFEWHEEKNTRNQQRHGIAFEDAKTIFYQPYHTIASPRGQEARFLAIGLLELRMIAVVFTYRNGKIRLISARQARKNEKTAYRETIGQKTGGTH